MIWDTWGRLFRLWKQSWYFETVCLWNSLFYNHNNYQFFGDEIKVLVLKTFFSLYFMSVHSGPPKVSLLLTREKMEDVKVSPSDTWPVNIWPVLGVQHDLDVHLNENRRTLSSLNCLLILWVGVPFPSSRLANFLGKNFRSSLKFSHSGQIP